MSNAPIPTRAVAPPCPNKCTSVKAHYPFAPHTQRHEQHRSRSVAFGPIRVSSWGVGRDCGLQPSPSARGVGAWDAAVGLLVCGRGTWGAAVGFNCRYPCVVAERGTPPCFFCVRSWVLGMRPRRQPSPSALIVAAWDILGGLSSVSSCCVGRRRGLQLSPFERGVGAWDANVGFLVCGRGSWKATVAFT